MSTEASNIVETHDIAKTISKDAPSDNLREMCVKSEIKSSENGVDQISNRKEDALSTDDVQIETSSNKDVKNNENNKTSNNEEITNQDISQNNNLLDRPVLPVVPSIDTLQENVLNLIWSYQEIGNNNSKEERRKEDHNYKNNLSQVSSSSKESVSRNCHSQEDISYTEEVEIRKKKRLNLTVALRNFNGRKLRNSFRYKKSKSEGSDSESGKKFGRTFKDFANGVTSILQTQKAITMCLEQPPAPLLVEDPPTDNEGGEGEVKSPNPLNG